MTTGLVRVRSPLLTESRLMSFPPVTEMFQFTGFASPTYGFSRRSSLRMGLPHSEIHGSTGARPSPWLIAACYVLHRLSVPRHPPDALIDAWSRQIMSRTETNLQYGSHDRPRRDHALRTIRTLPRQRTYEQRGPKRLGHSFTPIHDVQLPGPGRKRGPSEPCLPRGTCLVPPAVDTGTPSSGRSLVEADGIEPTTPCLQSRCSPS
jgi:hypothetical protein